MRPRSAVPMTIAASLAGSFSLAVAILGGPSMMAARPDQDRNARALTFESVGAFGGSYAGVVVSGTIAYASRGNVLEVLDVSDPSAPQLLGESERLPALGAVKAVGDGRAYLVGWHSGGEGKESQKRLHVIDVRDSGKPTLVGMLPLPTEALDDYVLLGSHIYIAAGTAGIMIVDVTEPGRPRLAGTVDLGMRITGVAEHGDGLLVAAMDEEKAGWMLAIEATDPVSPQIVGRVEVGWRTGKIAGKGEFAFVDTHQLQPGGFYKAGIRIVDVADMAAPQAVGELPLSEAMDFAMTSDRMYVLGGPGGVRDRYHLWSVDTSRLPEASAVQQRREWALAIDTVGDRLLLAAGPVGLVTIEDVADVNGEVFFDEHVRPVLGIPQGVALADGKAYLTDVDAELWVVDLGSPAAPEPLGHTELVHPYPYAIIDKRGGPLVVRDELAFVARNTFSFQPGGLHIVSLEDPAQPRQIGMWDPTVQETIDPTYRETGGTTGWYPPMLHGDRLWLSGNPALTELDVSNPMEPRYVRSGSVPYDGRTSRGLDVSGGATDGQRMYMAAFDSGVYLADVSDGADIEVVDKTEAPGYVEDVALVDRHLLTVGPGVGLRVLDAETLAPVRAIEGLKAGAVHVSDGTAFVLATDGFHAFDVGDPTLPVKRGAYAMDLDSDYTQFSVDGDLLAFTSGAEGMVLLQMADGESLPEPTAGPTLTPWPTRTPGGEPPRITPIPTPTFEGTPPTPPAPASPGPPATPTVAPSPSTVVGRVYLPVAVRGPHD